MKKLSKVEQLKAELKTAIKIEKTNKIFKSLSKAEQRVFIAKDVLESLKLKKYKAEHLIYVETNTSKADEDSKFNQDFVNCDDFSCKVCALGAIFTSKVKIANGFESGFDLYLYNPDLDDREMRNNLEKYFSRSQLKAIEHAFEGFENDVEDSCKTLDSKYKKFHKSYPNADKRMKAIMNNIIKNKGTFII